MYMHVLADPWGGYFFIRLQTAKSMNIMRDKPVNVCVCVCVTVYV